MVRGIEVAFIVSSLKKFNKSDKSQDPALVCKFKIAVFITCDISWHRARAVIFMPLLIRDQSLISFTYCRPLPLGFG